MRPTIDCATCSGAGCSGGPVPANCPAVTHAEVIEAALEAYKDECVRAFAREASDQEAECYMRFPEGIFTRNPRVEEVIQFARRMGYRKLGLAFCSGLRKEASILHRMLTRRGFEVASISCGVGSVPRSMIGAEENVNAIVHSTMCNPISQAELLNSEETDFNIVVGLCVGHDSLFLKHAEALTTVLIVKDRVFGHNPVAALYLSHSYYNRLMREEDPAAS